MKTRTFLKTICIASVLGLALPALADPVERGPLPDLTAAKIVLASLHRELKVPDMPNMSPRLYGAKQILGKTPEQTPFMQIAGRCGSSDYYCDSPGFTYCCGNSTDGFYCAADVNGC